MSFEQRNKEYFDKLADKYEAKPWQKRIVAQVSDHLRGSLEWIGVDWKTDSNDSDKQVRLLDYACGPGTIARALGPYVSQTRGVDLSPAMVERFNTLAKDAGLPREQIHAIVGNLLDDPSGGPITEAEFFDFDLAAIGLGFHHFERRTLMLQRIAERLKSGGVLLIVDFLIDKPPSEDTRKKWDAESQHTIAVHGFTEQDMREVYEQAGLVDFALQPMPEPIVVDIEGKEPQERKCFLARGRKP